MTLGAVFKAAINALRGDSPTSMSGGAMPEGTVAEPVVEPQPAVEPPAQEPPAEPAVAVAPEPEPAKPHALEPGGERFQQVWARAKAAEARMQEERDARIAAETEARILRETRTKEPEKVEQVVSWKELKQQVANNVITEEDALEYRDKITAEKAAKAAEERLTKKLTAQSTNARIDTEIGKYKDALPDVNVPGTDERKKFDTEFRYQVEFAGMDPKSLTTQLAALRAVYGPPERAVQYAKTKGKGTPGAESYAETSGGGRGPAPASKVWHDKLPAHEKAHYERMIERGRYGDPTKAWDNVKAEINEYNERKGLAKIG